MGPPHFEVALLGPVEARRDGVPLPLPHGRPTVILAALAYRAGAAVPVDALVHYLWPDGEPQHPRAAIQTHVTRLRSVLGRDAVQGAGDGYRLDVPAAAVDLVRFRGLVAVGPGAEPAGELKQLDEALSLWRGDPLSGLVPDTLASETAGLLVEELLGATERRNELCLRLGRVDDDFVPALRRLVGAHPWRERLWAQLILALYRKGRRGEALSAYHDLMSVLRDELGIDPGPELADLHRRMLASDPSLAGVASSTPRAATVATACQLPRPVADFVGRAREMDSLMSGLSAEQTWARIGMISGPGGSGKTTLALQVGHALRAAHPDGQLFAELHGTSRPADPSDILADFLRALGFDDEIPSSCDERASFFRSACADRKLLVVLDDARDAAQIRPLLPAAESCAVLVTSRPRLGTVSADVRVDLGLLTEREAYDLLAAAVGPSRLEAEPDAVDVVVESCQGSPLALRIVGGRLASRPSWPIGHLAARLRGGGRLDALEMGDLSVRATLTASVQALRPADAVRFRLLAALPGPSADVEAAAVAWNVDEEDARGSLERLVDVRLIDSTAPDHYRWHDLVDDYIRASANRGEADAARRRLVAYYLRSVHNTWPLLRQGAEATEDAAWFPHDVSGREFGGRAEVHAWLHPRWAFLTTLGRDGLRSAEQHEVDKAAALLLALGRSGYECCRDTRIEAVARAVLDAPRLGDRRLTARAWHGLALALGDQRRHHEALEAGAHGLAVRRELGDRYGEIIMRHNMAVWYESARQYEQAAELFEQCADADDVLSPQLRARCRRNLAHVQISLGRFEPARENLQRAWDTVDDHLDVDRHDHTAATAHLHLHTGAFEEAVQHYDEAVALATRIGSTSLRASALAGAARARRLAGRDGSAQAAQAVALARDEHLADIEAEALVETGHAQAARGASDAAAADWQAALRLYESLRSGEADDVRALLAALF